MLRQFGQQQDTFIAGGASREVSYIGPEFSLALAQVWSHCMDGGHWSNLPRYDGSIYLPDKYLEWFLGEGHKDAQQVDDVRRPLLGDNFETSRSLREKEAAADPANIRTDPTQDWLDSDYLRR